MVFKVGGMFKAPLFDIRWIRIKLFEKRKRFVGHFGRMCLEFRIVLFWLEHMWSLMAINGN